MDPVIGDPGIRPGVTFLMAYAQPTLGMERSTLRLAEELRSDFDVRIVVLKGAAPSLEGVRSTSLGGPPGRVTVADCRRLRRWAREETGLVVAVGAWIAVPWLVAVPAARRRTVVWEHSMVKEKIASSRRLAVLATLARLLYRTARDVVVVSDTLKADVDELCGVSAVRIPNLLPADERPTPDALMRRTSDDRRLLTIGSLTPTKNQSIAIRALAALDERFVLDIAGDGPDRVRLEHLASDLGVADRVRFHGHVDHAGVQTLLRDCDVVVHPAVGETFGLAYFEAAAASRPVAATRNRVAEQVVPDLVPGRLFDDTAELAQLLESGALSRIPPEEFSSAARRRSETYSTAAVVARWRRVIESAGSAHVALSAAASSSASRPRILVDHSGYELRNIGDLTMLVACVHRLQRLAPGAEIRVITVDADRLQQELPEVTPVLISQLPPWLPRRVRSRLRVRWKRVAKLMSAYGIPGLPVHRSGYGQPRLRSLTRAIDESDLVLAAGGGYVNDIFPAHGRGVLHVLRRAQRNGTPTVMVGQGLGPFAGGKTQALARAVFRGLDVLTLREGVAGPKILSEMGVEASRYLVTGDEALPLAARAEGRETWGTALGLNLRLAAYSAVSSEHADTARGAIAEFLRSAGSPEVLAVPVMSHGSESDLLAIRTMIPEEYENAALEPILTAPDLPARAARCRAILTGSYHAAVFGLAQGVPIVAVTNSTYYDWKFGGLRDLYGADMVRLVGVARPGAGERLQSAMEAAWTLGDEPRQVALRVTADLVERQDDAYRSFLGLRSRKKV